MKKCEKCSEPKRILGLWVVDYHSGSNSDFFEKPILNLGYELDIVPITEFGCEARLAKQLVSKKYDLLIHVPYRNHPRPEFIRSIAGKTKTLAINGDDEWLWKDPNGTAKLAGFYDYCATSVPESKKRYDRLGQKALDFNWGYSSDWKPKNVEKKYDVYFCGQGNPRRDEYLNQIIDAGIRIKVDGPGYSGKIDFKEMINRYRMAKIGINFVTGEKDKFIYQQVKCRNFEVPAVKTFMLSEWCPALDRFFISGEEIESFKTIPEAITKIQYYLRNDYEREAIATTGYERNKAYSFEKTLKRIFKEIL